MAFRIPPEAFKDIKDTYDARFTTLAGVTILFYDSLITFASEVRNSSEEKVPRYESVTGSISMAKAMESLDQVGVSVQQVSHHVQRACYPISLALFFFFFWTPRALLIVSAELQNLRPPLSLPVSHLLIAIDSAANNDATVVNRFLFRLVSGTHAKSAVSGAPLPVQQPSCYRRYSVNVSRGFVHTQRLQLWFYTGILTKRLVALYAQNKIIVRSIYITYVLCYFATGLVTIVSINYNYRK